MRLMRFICMALGAMAISCDEPAPVVSRPSEPQAYRVEVSSVAPLKPQLPTHFEVASAGEIFYVQERPDGDDVVFELASGLAPRPTALTSRAVVAAFDPREPASGNIHSIVNDPSARRRGLIFYFNGGTRRKMLSGLGKVDLERGEIRLLATQDDLASASDLGNSLALARGTVAVSGPNLWLFLRHDASSALFYAPLSGLGGGNLRLTLIQKIQAGNEALTLNHEEIDLSAGPEGSILLTDRWSGALWRVDTEGRATLVENLVALPENIATFGMDWKGNYASILGEGEAIEPRVEGRTNPAALSEAAPVFFHLRGKKRFEIGRDNWQTPSGFAMFSLRANRLSHDAATDTWLTHDAASGELLRLKLVPTH